MANVIGPADQDLSTRLLRLRDALGSGLVERAVAVRLALLAALSGEHLLLLGPPGTAKSLLARRLHIAIEGASYFERLLTRFSVPEELFGPLSIKALEADRYERLVDRYLPSASVAFLDEIFKANSAILNALLTLLNEREFDNGTVRVRTPLVSVVGASNELPEGEELDALYDRFLLRLHVGPVSPEGFARLIALDGDGEPGVPESLQLAPRDLERIRNAAGKVTLPADVAALLAELRAWCEAERIPVSDRRWRKIVKLLKVSAYTNRRTAVSIWDAWLLQHCLWETPEQRVKVFDWYAERVGATAAMDPSRLTRVVASWEGQLKRDKESRSQMRDESGEALYRKPDGALTSASKAPRRKHRAKEPLFLAPPDAFTHGDHWGNGRQRITDRTNGGNGYTEAELRTLRHSNGYDFGDLQGDAAYLKDPGSFLFEEADLPPAMEPTRHKAAYVRDCRRQVDELARDVGKYRESLAAHTKALEKDIRGHLWVTPDFVEPAAANLRKTAATVDALAKRVELLRAGFAALPIEQGSAQAPGRARKAS